MIKGVKFWNDRDCYYTQTNNPAEELLWKRSDRDRLVSCGPSAAVTCVAAMVFGVGHGCPGRYKPQGEEVLTDFFNDPQNYAVLKAARHAARSVAWERGTAVLPARRGSGVRGGGAVFGWGADFDGVAAHLKEGRAVQLCLAKLGHYIAAAAFDTDAREIIYNDPCPGRFADGNGFNRRMDGAEFKGNVKPCRIVYG
jgi:hypothetical protein